MSFKTGIGVKVKFNQCTEMRICDYVYIGSNTQVNPGNVQLVWMVGGYNSGSSSSCSDNGQLSDGHAEIKDGCTFRGSIYCNGGDLYVRGNGSGSYGYGCSGTYTNPTTMYGLYIAGKIYSSKYVTFNAATNCGQCTPTASSEAANDNSDALLADDLSSGNNILENYPDPFKLTTTFRIVMQEDTHVKLEVYDLNGKLINVAFNDDVQAQQEVKVEFNGTELSSGMYIYKLITSGDVKSGKMMLMKE